MLKEYKGCHLVIPVPEQLYYQHALIQMFLAGEIPDACGPKISLPHISVWYLGEVNQNQIERVVCTAQKASHLLKNQQLTVGGWGVFSGGYETLYWQVRCPDAVFEFRQRLENELPAGNNLPFKPHLTLVERVETKKGKAFLKNPPIDTRTHIDNQNTTFPIKYLSLWAKSESGNPSLPTRSLALIEI